MSSEDDIVTWLQGQPINAPIEIDGELVYLKVYGGGAELGVYLIDSFNQQQLTAALGEGFSSAFVFDGGLAVSPDGLSLLLTQWLPGVQAWSHAIPALEKLLSQVESWREELAPYLQQAPETRQYSREEQRMRNTLMGAR